MTLGIITSLSIRISWSAEPLLATLERMESPAVFPEEVYIFFSAPYMVAGFTSKICGSDYVDILNKRVFPLPR